jgi:hypothetical protein
LYRNCLLPKSLNYIKFDSIDQSIEEPLSDRTLTYCTP